MKSCHEGGKRKNHHLQHCYLVSASFSRTPSFFFIYLFALFSYFIISLSPPSSFFSLLPLSAAITDFFLPRLKYEYFRAKKLKGNNEMARKLNYTPFPYSQKRDFPQQRAHQRHVGVSVTSSHREACCLLLLCQICDIPTDLAHTIAK